MNGRIREGENVNYILYTFSFETQLQYFVLDSLRPEV
jgi:hypothetical protein